jgi:chitodextrinase
MSGYTIYRKKFVSICLHPMIWALLILLTAGCGDNASSPAATDNTAADASRTGSASFSIQWQPNNTVSASADDITRYAVDCATIGIDTITCKVYDENNNLVTESETWQCTDGGAKMDRIPEGSNLTFTIFGWNTDGNIIYQGRSETPVNIIAGETTDAGTIKANPFVPTGLEANAVSISQIDLTWNDLNAPGYRIYQDGVMVATATSPSFGVIDLTLNTQYCYTVSTIDFYGNESGQSDIACATPSDTQAPSTPTELNAVAVSASQIDISWETSNDDVGVAGYRVYRDGQEVGTTPTLTYSDIGLISNTEYSFTVAAYDEAGNQSPQTGQVHIITQQSFLWYLDEDKDGYGDPTQSILSVTQPEGYVSDNTDCNDEIASIHPGATEECNQQDDNCDQNVDEGLTFDKDDDGFTSVGSCQGSADDCNDEIGSINPGAEEVCDKVDNNCNDLRDEECPIVVNIDNEFTYINQGFPMGLSSGDTVTHVLSQTSSEKLIEPPFNDLYPLFIAHYGYLRIGNSEDDIISFILLEIFSSNEEPMGYEFFIDSDNDENLTNDDGPHTNQGTGLFATQVSVAADIITTSGDEITRPYQIWLWLNDSGNKSMSYYARCHYTGEVLIGGDGYTAVAFERSNHDALYRESGLYIDLNRDGQLDVETENFMDQTMVPMGGREYELSLDYP